MNKFYAGVGSRETPPEVCAFMKRIAQRLDVNGFTLRSGGAVGADRAFESGSSRENCLSYRKEHARGDSEADRIFRAHHPYEHRMTNEDTILLHRRNVYQILGRDFETPSAFVLCWTKMGSETEKQVRDKGWKDGGTGLAIAIASSYGVPVFNLRNADALSRFYSFYRETYEETTHD
jgi:hypothetical protein